MMPVVTDTRRELAIKVVVAVATGGAGRVATEIAVAISLLPLPEARLSYTRPNRRLLSHVGAALHHGRPEGSVCRCLYAGRLARATAPNHARASRREAGRSASFAIQEWPSQ
jgi:hypothetical protein